MKDTNRNSGNRKVISLFIGFLILFALAFSLGVRVGKDLVTSDAIRVAKDDTPPASSDRPNNGFGSEHEIGEKEKGNDQISIQVGIDGNEEKKGMSREPGEFEVRNKHPEIEDVRREETRKEDLIAEKSASASSGEHRNDSSNELEKDDQVSNSSVNTNTSKKQVEDDNEMPKGALALPPIEDGGKYTVQVGSFKDEKTAMELEKSLKSRGYPAFIKGFAMQDRGTLYRVRIGTFSSRKKAKLYGDSLKKLEPGINAVYISLND